MNNNWLYIRSEPSLWTVGFYDPSGKWHPESDHDKVDDAASRVHFLNGGNSPEFLEVLQDVSPLLDSLIERTPSGTIRNKLCDLNIKAKAAIKKATA